MSIFNFIKKVFNKILIKMVKQKKKELGLVKVDKGQLTEFNRKQQKVLVQGMEAGIDIERIAKKKYSAEQMLILTYGLTMGLDVSKYDSYAMTPTEMEYHMYMDAVEKFLGADYLKRLLMNGTNSIADKFIQKQLKADLMKGMEAYNEIASAVVTEEIEEKIATDEEVIYYSKLMKMCNNRGMDTSELHLDTITEMEKTYVRLEEEYAQKLDKRCIGLLKIKDYSLEPTLLSIFRGRSIEQRMSPIKLYSEGKLLNEFYQINNGVHIYLYRHKYIAIKIR